MEDESFASRSPQGAFSDLAARRQGTFGAATVDDDDRNFSQGNIVSSALPLDGQCSAVPE